MYAEIPIEIVFKPVDEFSGTDLYWTPVGEENSSGGVYGARVRVRAYHGAMVHGNQDVT